MDLRPMPDGEEFCPAFLLEIKSDPILCTIPLKLLDMVM